MSEREPSFLRGDGDVPRAAHGQPGFAPPQRTRPPASSVPPTGAPTVRETAAPTYFAAGFWRRLAGGLIDLAICAPIVVVLSWVAGSLTGIHLPAARYRSLDFWLDLLLASDPALLGGGGLAIAIVLVYALVFQLATGRTLGMRVVGARVIDPFGDPPSTARALLRTAGYLAGLATLGLGFVWIAFDSEKRGLHDYLSGTYVVKA